MKRSGFHGRIHLTRVSRFVAGIGLATTVLVAMGSTAGAVPPPPPNPSDTELGEAGAAVAAGVDRIGRLIVRIAAADQQLAELDAQVAVQREDVNRALVDLHAAQDSAAAAAEAVASSRLALQDAGAQISLAQSDFDSFARESYTRGSNSASLAAFLSTDGPDDLLDRAQVMRLLSTGREAVLDALERARTEQANSHSRARAAKLEADAAAAAAQQRKSDAEAAIAVAVAALDRQAEEKDRIEQSRAGAQAELDFARTNVTGLEGQRAEYVAWDRRRVAEDAARAAAAEVAREEASAASARVAADAAAAARAAELANGRRPHTDLGQSPLVAETPSAAAVTEEDLDATSPGSGDETGPGDGSEVDPADEVTESPSRSAPSAPRSTPSLTGTAAVETVIDRGLSQIGVPYAWGGGDENGPSRGIRDGGVADTYGDFGKVGFDCSGLMIYAFAGIGISLPHYTGYQYTAGTQVPSSEMRRGDMIFYGPNASQHVGLYLGDGTMLEAPQSGSHVMISPVRWDGMTPYVVRMVS
ncbi:cell wall-associated NlpC family hydrolase [Rhodococcus coprophilus]|uniref:Rpf-interacting protein n=2 Tax=Rhodococcus coprophilus TaxID=38310 RepID=A0A2X4TNR8_9NOCA|nr:cell wall-associated NlpC family hydrolase [Rhodococcus coprophilus]SQI28821.1 Rpf-interacting protein [Rhodococcus coprophilus]